MDSSNENRPYQQTQTELPSLPRIGIGYLLGVATMVAEFVALALHPEMAKPVDFSKGEFPPVPIYLFLASFIGVVYWLVCIYQVHVVLRAVPGWKHPISPAKAVGFHFIPFFSVYWIFKWPIEIARFVDFRLQKKFMKPIPVGIAILIASIGHILDSGLGLLLMFLPLTYVVQCVRLALAQPSGSSYSLPTSSE